MTMQSNPVCPTTLLQQNIIVPNFKCPVWAREID